MDNSLLDYDNIADRHDSREDTGITTGVRYRPLKAGEPELGYQALE